MWFAKDNTLHGVSPWIAQTPCLPSWLFSQLEQLSLNWHLPSSDVNTFSEVTAKVCQSWRHLTPLRWLFMTSVLSAKWWLDSLTLRRQCYFPLALWVCNLWRGVMVNCVHPHIEYCATYLHIRKSHAVGFVRFPRSGGSCWSFISTYGLDIPWG